MGAVLKSERYVRPLPGFAGVALADILANSVAILIIMIVVTLMVRHEQEEERLEQTEEVSVVLSRELASSLVMNDLPTSPPAVLHDYVTSPLDRNPSHTNMPIIELHDDFIRDYYTGKLFTRDELLFLDNAFDAYVASLNPSQLVRMRVDIYSIKLFYIAMSILKDHNHSPRHWHFLGYAGAANGGWLGVDALRALRGDDQATRQPGEGDSPSGRSGSPLGDAPLLPEDVAPAAVEGGSRNYPLDPFSTGRGQGRGDWGQAQEYLDLPGAGSGVEPSEPGPGQRSDQDGDGRGQGVRFRSANPATMQSVEIPGEAVPLSREDLLRGLLAFMDEVQQDADQQLPSRLAQYNFLHDIVTMLESLPEFEDLDRVLLVRDLGTAFANPGEGAGAAPGLEVESDPGISGQALIVAPNSRIRNIFWQRDPNQPELDSLPEPLDVSLHLNLHAEIYKGLRIQLEKGSIMMMPTAAPDAQPRWRVLTMISPQLDDFVTGFVYAAVDDQGRLLLPADVNAVEIGGLRVEPHFPSIPHRGKIWSLLFYGLLTILIIVGVFHRRRKNP